jgi:hypothetical protein
MLGLVLVLTFDKRPKQILVDECDVWQDGDDLQWVNQTNGSPFAYLQPKQGDWKALELP